jgi:ADP-ribose pyrophosphatase YjhB (NUDIX family)
MNYCSHCGAKVAFRIPAGDNLPRFVCETCAMVHYQNPRIVAGCIPEWQNQILLCRRAIEPKYGLWTFPAGFMENGETIEQAAIRETLEEAEADVELTSLYAVFSIPHISQVYMIFRGRVRNPDFKAGHESLEVQLFRPEEIPWETLAFRVIHETLERYVQDRHSGFGRGVQQDDAPPRDGGFGRGDQQDGAPSRDNGGFPVHTGKILPATP